jgi:hypothetical protein
MSTRKTLTELKELHKHLEFYNEMAPFPVYDTEYVGAVKKVINFMEESKVNYDMLPVAACKHCKSLHIVIDEVENNHCMRCGSINEIELFVNIDEYLATKEDDEQ